MARDCRKARETRAGSSTLALTGAWGTPEQLRPRPSSSAPSCPPQHREQEIPTASAAWGHSVPGTGGNLHWSFALQPSADVQAAR